MITTSTTPSGSLGTTGSSHLPDPDNSCRRGVHGGPARRGYSWVVAAPVSHWPQGPDRPAAPDADPVSIRAVLPAHLTVIFDAEWEHTLETAKRSKDLAGVRTLLAHWRLQAWQELVRPGSHDHVL